MEVLWDQTPERDWARHAAGAAMQQAWAYGEACRALGSRVLRAEVRDGGRVVALAQLVHRKLAVLHASVCTRGPVWTDPDADRAGVIGALKHTLPLPFLRGLFVTPEGEADAVRKAGLSRVMTPYTTAELDLTQSPDILRAAMHQKWRNRLVRAESAGLIVRRADRRQDLYAWLLDEELKQQRQNRYAALSPSLVSAWHQAGGGLRVYTAHQDGDPIAAMLFLIHGKRATYHIGWSGAEGKRLSAHNLLMWTAMTRLPKIGVERLDLGGLNTEDVPGIARFKLGTGAKPVILHGTWFGR